MGVVLGGVTPVSHLRKVGLGFIKINFEKLKFFIARAHAPIFSDNCGLCKIKEKLLNIKYLLVLYP